jgi:N-acetylmuramoyl-L-alanine amidase
MRKVNFLVLHCTATPQTATVQSIQKYWKENLGWKSPGYHHIIEPSGEIVTLADDERVCNGVKGHNANSIHISYIGGVNGKKAVDNRTEAQKQAQISLITHYKEKYPGIIVLGHRDFVGVSKSCPSFDVKSWLRYVGWDQ